MRPTRRIRPIWFLHFPDSAHPIGTVRRRPDCGMTRSTGKAEIVRAAEECIGYQITDLVLLMQEASGMPVTELRVDGGPTKDRF